MKVPREVLPTVGLTLLAHVPCCLPVLILAIGGATTSGLTWLHALDPYRPYLLGLSGITLGFAFWSAYKPVNDCSCPTHGPGDHAMERRIKIVTVWCVAALAVSLAVFVRHDDGPPSAAATTVKGP